MGNTFGGEHHRPRDDKRHDRQRGHSRRQLEDRASFDNESKTSCLGCFLIALTICAAVATAIGLAVT